MNPSLSEKYSTKAARLVDDNVARVSSTLAQFGQQFSQDDGSAQNQFGPVVARQINKMTGKLEQLRGDEVVDSAKAQITRHPTALTIAGALTGAALVRLAIMAVKNEQQAEPDMVEAPIMSDAP